MSLNEMSTIRDRRAQNIRIRRAVVDDTPQIAELVNYYARLGEMLPRPLLYLYQGIRDFVVAEEDGQIIGCGALRVMWSDLAEIRSLAVAESHRRRGIGALIARELIAEAERLGLTRVFALTYQVRFFETLGFREVSKESLPQKSWTDCLTCPKVTMCDEVPVMLELAPGAGRPANGHVPFDEEAVHQSLRTDYGSRITHRE